MAYKAKKITSAAGRFSNSTVTNSDESFKKPNIADYTVKKKVEGQYRTKRILYWVVYFLVLVGLMVGGFAIKNIRELMIIMAFVIFIGAWVVEFFTWRYFCVDYSYAIENGEFFATEIYGERADKLLVRIKMSQIKKVAPYEGIDKTALESKTFSKKTEIMSTYSSPDIYYLIYDDEKGGEGLVIFDACSKSLTAFKYYNSAGTVVRQTTR